MQEQQEVSDPSGSTRAGGRQPSLAVDLTLYTLARLGMVLALTAALLLFRVPLLVALAVSVVVVMPLSLVLLKGLRHRVAVGVEERARQRRARRDELRAQLRGEREEEPTDGADDQPATSEERS